MNGVALSRHYTAERRYRQADIDRMRSLADLVIRMISPFERLERLTAGELAVISAARTIHSYIREDGAGTLHLRQSCQLTLEEISANGHC